ncbi:MAG: neutral zinc metallopeptidase [Candidatus Promineifilaceae bacterium]
MKFLQRINRTRFIFLTAIVVVLATLGLVDNVGAQTDSAECYHLQNGDLSVVDSDTGTTECAISIYQNADQSDGVAYGGWGDYYLGINADGDVYYSRNARRWRFWDTIDIPTAAPVEPEPETVEPVAEGAGDDDGDGVTNSADQCPNERETYNNVFDSDGCPDTVNDLLNFAANDLNGYWSAEFETAGITYYEPRSVSAYRSTSRRSGAYNAYYSRGSHSIAYDLNLMEDVLRQQGDLAPVYILAHEWGHLVQGILNRFAGRDTYFTEQEADCLAGVYVKNLDERGLLEEGDLDEGIRQAWAVGDHLPVTHPGAHGSPQERANAFALGFEEGSDACFSEYE